jgi:arginine deiminase
MQFVVDLLKKTKIKGYEYNKNENEVTFNVNRKYVIVYSDEKGVYNISIIHTDKKSPDNKEKFLNLNKEDFVDKIIEFKNER